MQYMIDVTYVWAIKFGVSRSMQYRWTSLTYVGGDTIDVTYVCWWGQVLGKIRNSTNILAHQNLLIYSNHGHYKYETHDAHCWNIK